MKDTRAYRLRDKACRVYFAIESRDIGGFRTASRDFADYLGSKETLRYLGGWAKLTSGEINGVQNKEAWLKNFVDVINHTNSAIDSWVELADQKQIEIWSSIPIRKLERELLSLSSVLAVMDIHEEEIEAAYAKV